MNKSEYKLNPKLRIPAFFFRNFYRLSVLLTQLVHLLSAALMSAPASLAISKVLCPETSPNRLNGPQSTAGVKKNELKKNAFPASNLLEAATVGISMSIAPVAGILFRTTFKIHRTGLQSGLTGGKSRLNRSRANKD